MEELRVVVDCDVCKNNNYLDVVGVTRAVCVGVMSVGRGVFHMGSVDGDSSRLLLRRIVDVLIFFVVSPTGVAKH